MEELTTEPIAALPNPSYIARAANRLRRSSRPKDPTDLEFELNEECLPEISYEQMSVLAASGTWSLPLTANCNSWSGQRPGI